MGRKERDIIALRIANTPVEVIAQRVGMEVRQVERIIRSQEAAERRAAQSEVMRQLRNRSRGS